MLSKFSGAKTLCLKLLLVSGCLTSHQTHAKTPQTLYKWWTDKGKIMLVRNIIEQHYINDGQIRKK